MTDCIYGSPRKESALKRSRSWSKNIAIEVVVAAHCCFRSNQEQQCLLTLIITLLCIARIAQSDVKRCQRSLGLNSASVWSLRTCRRGATDRSQARTSVALLASVAKRSVMGATPVPARQKKRGTKISRRNFNQCGFCTLSLDLTYRRVLLAQCAVRAAHARSK